MPSKTEKQKRFFGAVMGAKKGQKGVSGKAKKVAKEMPKKEIKKFLKTEEEDEQIPNRKNELNVAYRERLENLAYRKQMGEITPEQYQQLYNSTVANYKKQVSEEDEQSVVKQMKKGGGKAAFEGPNVKERKHFAPSTQRHKAKKGKGSYDRKKSFDENEEKACWKGYKKEGMKKKGDKIVNNCVKESNSILNFLEAIMTKNHSDAHKYLKDTIDKKLQMRIADEINTPLF